MTVTPVYELKLSHDQVLSSRPHRLVARALFDLT